MKNFSFLLIFTLFSVISQAQEQGDKALEVQFGPSIIQDSPGQRIFNVNSSFYYTLAPHWDLRLQLGYSQFRLKDFPEFDAYSLNLTYGLKAYLFRNTAIRPFVFAGSSFQGTFEKTGTNGDARTRFDLSTGLNIHINKSVALGAEIYYLYARESNYDYYPVVFSAKIAL